MDESHILENKMKSLEKETFVLIFSRFFMFILSSDVNNFHFCSMKSSRRFLKNLFVLCRSHIAQLDLLTCEEDKSLAGEERGDSSKGSRYDRRFEERAGRRRVFCAIQVSRRKVTPS